MPTFKKFMAMPPPMVPAPMIATDLDVALGDVLVEVRHIGGLALGEKHVLQRLRLAVLRTLHEQFALPRHALFKGKGGGGFHSVDDALRREQIFLLLRDAFAGCVEESGRQLARVDLEVANLAQRRILRGECACIVEGTVEQVALDDLIDDAGFGRLRGGHRIARDDDAERGFDADQARQPLGSAGTREQAQFDLRQSDFGGGDRDPIVAAERDFQAAAECGAMNGRDDGLRRTFHGADGLVQTGRQRRLAKFGDVGARHEGAALARNDADFYFWIQRELCDAVDEGGAHADTDGIDGRIVDPNDSNVAALFESALHVFLQWVARSLSSLRL